MKNKKIYKITTLTNNWKMKALNSNTHFLHDKARIQPCRLSTVERIGRKGSIEK